MQVNAGSVRYWANDASATVTRLGKASISISAGTPGGYARNQAFADADCCGEVELIGAIRTLSSATAAPGQEWHRAGGSSARGSCPRRRSELAVALDAA